jgi:hypothetical protein
MPTMQPENSNVDDMLTDTEAQALLPPNEIARATYAAHRAEGCDCRRALHQTLETWREYWGGANPIVMRGPQRR